MNRRLLPQKRRKIVKVRTVTIFGYFWIEEIKTFIAADWKAHRYRVCAEVTGMMLSLLVAIVIAFTTPNPPLLLCYVLWEIASMLLVSAAISRRSLGLTVLYAGFLVIDCIGLIRTVLA